MRFFQAAVLALAFGAVAFSGVDAKRKHHTPLFSQTAPSEMELQDMFSAYMKQFDKKYTHDEVAKRFATFKVNVEDIRLHNTQKNSSYTKGLNQFSDLTAAEFKSKYYGYKPIKNEFLRSKNPHQPKENVEVPTSVDWRNSDAVTPVKNQGQCGSCWAFSTTGSTEGAWVLQGGNKLVSLSEEQLVDCSAAEGNQGCSGGLMDQGFQYILDNKGLCTEAAYPYVSSSGTSPGSCSSTSCESVVTITGFSDVPANDEKSLLNAVGTYGPVSVAIEADQTVFQSYTGGVINDASCGTTLDHGVLIVGYGTDSSTGTAVDYWIVKNSWGATWGESGYVRLARNVNQCGISQQASYPTIKK